MNIFDNISKNNIYKKWFKKSLPYLTGGILLAVFQIINFVFTGNPWGVSGVLANWGAWVYELLGGSVGNWHYFNVNHYNSSVSDSLFNSPESMRNIGIVVGALISALIASEFRIRKIKTKIVI